LEAAEAYVSEVGKRSIQIRGVIAAWTARTDQDQNEAMPCYQSSDVKFTKLFSSVGTKHVTMNPRFDAPNVWLSLASVADEINARNELQSKEIKDLKVDLSSRVTKNTLLMQQQSLFQRMAELETFAVESVKKLQRNFLTMINRVPSISSRQSPSIDVLRRLEKMEKEMTMICSMNDESAVKYAYLGFSSQRESDAWIKANLQSGGYGLLVTTIPPATICDYDANWNHICNDFLIGRQDPHFPCYDCRNPQC